MSGRPIAHLKRLSIHGTTVTDAKMQGAAVVSRLARLLEHPQTICGLPLYPSLRVFLGAKGAERLGYQVCPDCLDPVIQARAPL